MTKREQDRPAGPRSKGLRHCDFVMVTGAGNVLILMARLTSRHGPDG